MRNFWNEKLFEELKDMDNKHWTNINPLTVTTNSSNTPFVHPTIDTTVFPFDSTGIVAPIYKYKIGDVFVDEQYGDTIEITGYNHITKSYSGVVEMHIGGKIRTIETSIIYENRLDRMTMLIDKSSKSNKKDEAINYRIYYFEEGKGNRPVTIDVKLSNIRALAKYLNSIIKMNPKRRIVMVAITDENGIYYGQVKLLKKEISEQKFLTGMKERLLAYAKYECGYEIATNF